MRMVKIASANRKQTGCREQDNLELRVRRISFAAMKLPKDRVAVKICGVNNREDALAAIDAGADLLGFNTWRGTKRFVDLEANAEWIAALPVTRVALLINASLEEAKRVAALPFIDALQLHGDEDATFCKRAVAFGKPLIKAIRLSSSVALYGADQFSTPHILVDAHVPGAFGGTGASVDLVLARSFREQFPQLTLWLAGGLQPDNVVGAIRVVRPQVVDVSSGVEIEPARKDPAKMRRFIAAAHQV